MRLQIYTMQSAITTSPQFHAKYKQIIIEKNAIQQNVHVVIVFQPFFWLSAVCVVYNKWKLFQAAARARVNDKNIWPKLNIRARPQRRRDPSGTWTKIARAIIYLKKKTLASHACGLYFIKKTTTNTCAGESIVF